jgi:hypothetical protein
VLDVLIRSGKKRCLVSAAGDNETERHRNCRENPFPRVATCDDALHEFIHVLGNGRSVVMEANQLYVTRLGEISKRNQIKFNWTACRYVSECISRNVITSAYLQVFHIMQETNIC